MSVERAARELGLARSAARPRPTPTLRRRVPLVVAPVRTPEAAARAAWRAALARTGAEPETLAHAMVQTVPGLLAVGCSVAGLARTLARVGGATPAGMTTTSTTPPRHHPRAPIRAIGARRPVRLAMATMAI